MVEHNYIECVCSSVENTLRVSIDPTDPIEPIWIDVHLSPYRRWYERIWPAIRYVFGYRSKHGDFDSTYLTRETAAQMVCLLQRAYPEPETIAKRISDLNVRSQEIAEEVSILRKQCSHPNFAPGFSLMGGVHNVMICTDCGEARPYENNDCNSVTVSG